MEINSTRADRSPSQGAVLAGANHFPPISQLPTELLVAMFGFALVRGDFNMRSMCLHSHPYVKQLYVLRSVTKQWHDIIEGTPSFWTIIVSTLPYQVNETSIRLSANLPLTIVYRYSPYANRSAPDFLKSIGHTRQRWSTVVLFSPTNISEYIGDPAPLLRKIIVWGSSGEGGGPFELLGGDTASLRHVELKNVSVCWKVGSLVRLGYLDLRGVAHNGLTGSHLLDVLRTSPGLQVLKLEEISINVPPPSPIITLHQLKCIDLDSCAIDLVQYILRHIRAPSCTKLRLCISEDQGLDIPHFINEIMAPFSGILLAIHKRYGESEIRLGSGGFFWHTEEDSNADRDLLILIEDQFDPLFVEWVNRILQNERGLRINFDYGAPSDEAVLGRVARMRCVTEIFIEKSGVGPEGASPILKFLGQPLNINPSLPPVPYLRELRITWSGLSLQDLLDMVQSRFCGLSWETMEPTPLTIDLSMDRGVVSRYDMPPAIIEFATLVKIRETNGVECAQIVGTKNPVGMLAIKWDEEASRPVWV